MVPSTPLPWPPPAPYRTETPPKTREEAPDALLEGTSKEGIQAPAPHGLESFEPEAPSRVVSLEALMGPTT